MTGLIPRLAPTYPWELLQGLVSRTSPLAYADLKGPFTSAISDAVLAAILNTISNLLSKLPGISLRLSCDCTAIFCSTIGKQFVHCSRKI